MCATVILVLARQRADEFIKILLALNRELNVLTSSCTKMLCSVDEDAIR